MNKVRVRKHIKTNRLFIDLQHTLTRQDLELLKSKLKNGLKKMKPPFGAIVNQIRLAPIDDSLGTLVSEIMTMNEKAGCKKVVRVIGNNALVKMQAAQARKQQQAKIAYDIDFVDTIEKAIQILKELGL